MTAAVLSSEEFVMTEVEGAGQDPVAQLLRWEVFGAEWAVVHRDEQGATVSLRRCDGGEEVGRLTSDDPALLAFLDARTRPEPLDPRPEPDPVQPVRSADHRVGVHRPQPREVEHDEHDEGPAHC